MNGFPVINDSGRNAHAVLVSIEKHAAYVIRLKHTPGKPWREWDVHADASNHCPGRAAGSSPQADETSRVEEQSMDNEELIAPRKQNLSAKRQVSKIDVGAILAADFGDRAKAVSNIKCRRKSVSVQLGVVGKAEWLAVEIQE